MKTTRKLSLATLVCLMACMCFASGVYLVSGGDFRKSYIKYTIETSEPNQQVQLSPSKVRVLGVYSNKQYEFPWSIRCEGQETEYLENQCFGQSASGGVVGNKGENAPTLYRTFTNPGSHKVRIFDEHFNIYQITFNSNDITDIYIDQEDWSSAKEFNLQVNIYGKKLKSIYYNNPKVFNNKNTSLSLFARDTTNVVDLVIAHPERFLSLDYLCSGCQSMTNDMIFVNATNVGNYCFSQCGKVQYASFPNAKIFGTNTFNISTCPTTPDHGLHKLRIGENIEQVGVNTFYGHEFLTTIEFATTAGDDWIEKWNNHPILPNWLGTASKQTGDGENEATITPIIRTRESPESEYYTSIRNPRPTRLVKVSF